MLRLASAGPFSIPNTDAIGQTLGNARRIAEILNELTGHPVNAQPVLVFAGKWWIDNARPKGGRDAIWVLNDEALIKWIRNAPSMLTREDIDIYATRLREYAQRR